MKSYLSSYRIPDQNKFASFVGKDINEIKFGLVLNSKDYKTVKEREEKLKELIGYFSNLGLKVEEIDLREFFNNDGLEERLKQYDVIWFNGGNTYMLRSVIEKVGGVEKMVNILDKNNLVYGGDSAGAVMAGSTLKYFEEADDPSVVSNVMYDSLNLIDFVILPHWGSKEYGEAMVSIKNKLEKDNYKTIELTDEEFVLVENKKVIK
ncbi:Type 1 glutamine amidotransferase-like domain-containing protein [Patescibacteria group bacterium]